MIFCYCHVLKPLPLTVNATFSIINNMSVQNVEICCLFGIIIIVIILMYVTGIIVKEYRGVNETVIANANSSNDRFI